MRCVKCGSREVEASETAMAVGAQVGSVIGCILTVAAGPLVLLGLLAGGVAGAAAGGALDDGGTCICSDCGHRWQG
jgi:hypothetical protein